MISNSSLGAITVGGSGSGALNVLNGGSVSNTTGTITIAATGSGTGVVVVDGKSSDGTRFSTLNSTGPIDVAPAAPELNISNGGVVAVSSVLLGSSGGGAATVTFSGGVLRANAAQSNWISLVSGPSLGNVYVAEGGATFDTGASLWASPCP